MARFTGVKKVHDVSEGYSETIVENEEAWNAATEGYLSDSNDDDDVSSELQEIAAGPPLPETVNGLAMVVGELKEQLTDLVRVNEALETDLEHAGESMAEGDRERYLLIQKIHEIEDRSVSVDDLRAEIKQLSRERDTLVDKVQDLSQVLTTSEQRVKETGGLLDRFRTERNDASQEADCLNSQFSRAMKVIDELRSEKTMSLGREEDLKGRIEVLEKRIGKTVSQRDSFKSELTASRNALEEVRRSILAASKESQKALYEG